MNTGGKIFLGLGSFYVGSVLHAYLDRREHKVIPMALPPGTLPGPGSLVYESPQTSALNAVFWPIVPFLPQK